MPQQPANPTAVSVAVTKAADCFNFVRLTAAFLVMIGHMYVIAGRAEPTIGSFSLTGVAIAMFLSVSGYLVAQSWALDPNLARFAVRRALRIFPALAVTIVLTVVALGPLASTLPTTVYFSRPETWMYLRNIGLYPDYYLPGVFVGMPVNGVVNGSLWTLPLGVLMYLTLGVLGLFKIVDRPYFMLVWVVILCAGSILCAWYFPRSLIFGPFELHQILTYAPYFWVAALIYAFRAKLDFTLARAIAVYSVTLALLGSTYLAAWSWFAIPYIVISFARQSDRLFRVPWQIGDLSYGIFLYAFPVSQLLWKLNASHLPLFQIMAIAALASTLLAWASWEIIEYPALHLKPKIRARQIKLAAKPAGAKK